ncbi:cell division cycle 48C, partial [Tanacetum coccineum]
MAKTSKPSPAKSSRFEKQFFHRLTETYGTSPPSSSDVIISDLRNKYPDYRRHKLQVFTRTVKQTLKSKQNIQPLDTFHDDVDMTSSSSKKSKKIDDEEERLLMLESKHVKRRRVEVKDSSESDSSEEDRSAVSNSEDDEADYVLKFEPEVDVTKEMLRKKYSKPNYEVEVVTNSSNKKTDLMREVKTPVKIKPSTKKPNSLSNDGGEVDGKGGVDGPKFKDLGGMDAVLDELKMEVIVPLYHPELPRSLGVRPMAGILLHGPPGCGKTKLAHAIANETGVPFYKISATELVSGIS